MAALDQGSGTTSCTQKYSRSLDGPAQDCDAGHILANRLGGPGNQPLNIFPQSPAVNRGVYNKFEAAIYECIKGGSGEAGLKWHFTYGDEYEFRPVAVKYSVDYKEGNAAGCNDIDRDFSN